MQLHYITRTEYRQKNKTPFTEKLKQQFGDVYILPEGGSNTLAIKGCKEIVHEISHQVTAPFDVICCASGTGGTLAGLISALSPKQKAIGFSVLKNGGFLTGDVKKFLKQETPSNNWHIETDFHFSGYAKINNKLISFMKKFQTRHGIPLDAVYTGKMFYGLFKRIEAKAFKRGTTIIALHSGGLQGNAGFKV